MLLGVYMGLQRPYSSVSEEYDDWGRSIADFGFMASEGFWCGDWAFM